MPQITRHHHGVSDDYKSDDDLSSNSCRTNNSGNYRKVRRYRVNSGRVEEIQDFSQIPRSERIIGNRSQELFPSNSSKFPKATESQCKREFGLSNFKEKKNESEKSKYRGKPFKMPWESNLDINNRDNRIEKNFMNYSDEQLKHRGIQMDNEYYFNLPEPTSQSIATQRGSLDPQKTNSPKALTSCSFPGRSESKTYNNYGQNMVANYSHSLQDTYSDSDSDKNEFVTRQKSHRRKSSNSHLNSLFQKDLVGSILTGAGISTILKTQNENNENSTFNILGGAALGAIGAEAVTKARDVFENRHSSSIRSKSTSRNDLKRVKSTLGIAAAGLAAAAAANQYTQIHKGKEEESSRGRSRSRSQSKFYLSQISNHSYSSVRPRSRSRHKDPNHRSSVIAVAGAAAATLTGVVQHLRSRSQNRNRSRSHSRIKTGAEIVGGGLAGAVAADIYERHKESEISERNKKELIREHRGRSKYRSKSRTRSRSRSIYPNVDLKSELEMVQYGSNPVYTRDVSISNRKYHDQRATPHRFTGSRSLSRRRRNSSSGITGHRSAPNHSRILEIADALTHSAAAAIGIHSKHPK